ncbi:MAG TPA: hypothetical protein VI895_05450 [Bdellovibrionota bacterium]|nr:hypothetical protein [Bdellovibrionota bacterium]
MSARSMGFTNEHPERFECPVLPHQGFVALLRKFCLLRQQRFLLFDEHFGADKAVQTGVQKHIQPLIDL